MRDDALDAARGAAFVLMCVNHYGIATTPTTVTRAAGHVARVAFLLLVGATFAMYPRSTRARARRVALIAAHAALVSAASWYLLPRAWIRVGVLHCTALCTLALTAMDHARLLGPTRTVLAAGLCLAAYHAAPVTHTALDLVTGASARVTMLDWFPPLHWMPVVLGGHSLGAAVRPALKLKLKLKHKPSFLSWVGRRSLELYTAQMLVLLVARAHY
jgi:uncharacterized membrane protein